MVLEMVFELYIWSKFNLLLIGQDIFIAKHVMCVFVFVFVAKCVKLSKSNFVNLTNFGFHLAKLQSFFFGHFSSFCWSNLEPKFVHSNSSH